MYIPNYPEDSTLRRHFDSAAALRHQESLAQPPTDSILRRHYEQLHPAKAGGPPSLEPRQPPPSPAPEPHAPGGGGLFGWLVRLFR